LIRAYEEWVSNDAHSDHRANSAEEGDESLFEIRGQLMLCWHDDFAGSVVAE